jgi:hypothetical protein
VDERAKPLGAVMRNSSDRLRAETRNQARVDIVKVRRIQYGQIKSRRPKRPCVRKNREDGKSMRRLGHSSFSRAPSDRVFRAVLPAFVRAGFADASA